MKRPCGSSNEKQGGKLLLSWRIERRSCGQLSGLGKNRHVGKPNLRLKRIETAGWYATVRFVTLLWPALQLTFESRLSLPCMHIVGHASESEVHASGKFCSISDPCPPPPLSLSLSPCDHIRVKESLPLNSTIRTSKWKSAKCGHQVQVSSAPTASMQWLIQKKKCRAFFCNAKLCLWILNDLRRVAALGNYMLSDAIFVHSVWPFGCN